MKKYENKAWYEMYKALRDNNCKYRDDLERYHPEAYAKANETHIPRGRGNAWVFAELAIESTE